MKSEFSVEKVPDKPWWQATTEPVRDAISGTALEPVVEVLRAPTDPPLPLEAVVGKALALAGSQLAGPRAGYDPDVENGEHGVELARFRILTGGCGQVTNFWNIVVAATASGKDIGGLAAHYCRKLGNLLATSGSAEGLYDACREKGAGVLLCSEFEAFLDKASWQSRARPMLTTAFNQGYFDVATSKRGRSASRRADYCFPSIVTCIQPEILKHHVTSLDIRSGFLTRFLFSTIPDGNRRPATGAIDHSAALAALEHYGRIEGSVTPERGYLSELHDAFREHGAMPEIYDRHVNEYGPRIACVLQADGAEIRQETWDRTRTLLLWFYGMAERVLEDVGTGPIETKFERFLRSYLAYIRRKTPSGGVTKKTISHNKNTGTDGPLRTRILDELVERGDIMKNSDGCYVATGAKGGERPSVRVS